MSKYHFLCLLLLALPGAIETNKLFADDNLLEQQEDEPRIVVVTKRPKDMNELGLSIQVLTEDSLEQMDSAESITEQLSGVQAAISNGSQTTFQIRGIGAVDHQALTPTAAAVYVDGVYLATNVQASPMLFDLERAEVIKGPQGSLYGRNASAGAIHFISSEPEADTALRLAYDYGNYDRNNLNWMLNQPVNDRLFVRVSGRHLKRNPVIENVVTNTDVAAPAEAGGTVDEFGTRLSMKYLASDKSELILRAHYAEDKGINPAPFNGNLESSLSDHQISVGADGVQDSDNDFYGGSITYKYSHADYQLDWITAREGYHQRYGFDFDGTPAPFDIATLNANLAYDRYFAQSSTELRISSVTNNVEWMLGTHLASEDFEQSYLIWCGDLDPVSLLGTCPYVGAPGRTGSEPASDSGVMSLLSEIQQSRETAAIFSFNTIEINSRLDAVVGGRLSYERIHGAGTGKHIFNDGTIALNNRNDLGPAIGENTLKEHFFTVNLGLNYQLTDKHLGYINLSNGFKSGGFNGEVINNAQHFSDQGLFRSEKVNSLELGIKYAEAAFSYNLSAFGMYYKRPQARIFVPFALSDGGYFTSNSLSNLDRAKSYGIESDFVWRPQSNFKVAANITWLNTRIIQNIDPQVPQNAETFDGNPLPFAADLSAALNAEYRWNIGGDIDAVIQVSAKYQDDFYLDAEALEDRKQSAYSLYNANFALNFNNGMDIKLWGKNLSDANYAISGFGFIGYNRFLGIGRTYGISIGYSY